MSGNKKNVDERRQEETDQKGERSVSTGDASAGRGKRRGDGQKPVARDAGSQANVSFEAALREFFIAAEEAERDSGELPEVNRVDGAEKKLAETAQEYLTFRLANESFALSILNIKEIIKLPLITPVPRTEPVILGVLSLRGTVVPVLDLRKRLRLDTNPQDRRTRILIIQIDGGLIGLLVDEVRHVIRLREEEIEPPPAVFGRVDVEHLQGVGRHEGEMYTLLDVASVVQLDRLMLPPAGEAFRG